MIQPSRVLKAGKRVLAGRWTYAGAAVIALVAATSMALGGVAVAPCKESPGELAGRLSELQKTYVTVYQEESAEIQACQSLECERPAKLQIAVALRSYNEGLGHICWSTGDESFVNRLTAANATAAAAYNSWADAASPADDQVFAHAADRAVASQQAESRTLKNQLQQ